MSARGWIIVGAAAAYAGGLLLQVPGFNGPWYWTWRWRDLDLIRSALPFCVPLFGLLLVRATFDVPDGLARPRRLLIALAGAHFLSQLAGVMVDPAGFRLIGEIVRSANATSYYSDALKIQDLGDFLSRFHELDLNLHSSTHPPGPILYYWVWIRLLGPDAGAVVGGCALGAIAAAGVPAVYALAGLWTSKVRDRLSAALAYALTPASILFFPEFDQVYPLLTIALIYFWVKSLEERPDYAWAFGAALWVSTFFAYQLLTLGAFMALYTAYFLFRRDPSRPPRIRALAAGAIALGVWASLYALLYGLGGFRPLASFLHALAAQDVHARHFEIARPYLDCVVLDLYDFLIGGSLVSVLPLLYYLGGKGSAEPEERRAWALSLMGLLTILAVDLTGLLRAETARVWLYLQPLLALPVGLQIARMSPADQTGAVVARWLILVVMKCKLWFIHV